MGFSPLADPLRPSPASPPSAVSPRSFHPPSPGDWRSPGPGRAHLPPSIWPVGFLSGSGRRTIGRKWLRREPSSFGSRWRRGPPQTRLPILRVKTFVPVTGPLTFIAFLTDPEPITRILAHIGEPTSPPLLHPPRGPPQTELDMGPAGGETEEAARGSFPDDLDQTPEFDSTAPEPVPEDDFDHSWGA